jgi:hypothetical protein
MVRRSWLLRVLLNTRILVPSTTERCLHIARGLVHAAIPCEAYLLTQSSSCEAPFYARGAQGSEGAHFYTRGARGNEGAHFYTRGARGSEGAHFYTRGARGNEGAHFYTRGAQGNEGAHVLHRWARSSDSRGHGSSEVLGFAAPPLRGLLLTQTYPAKHT